MCSSDLDRGLKFLIGAHTESLQAGAVGRVAHVRFKDGSTIDADLVVMAVGIRPNTELAERMRLHCQRGIVVNDTMQTVTDARIYSVGECASHRGVAYGLVAPLFEQAKVAANHLAQFGIGRYSGSLTSTKLKVTGIDLFSAGDFIGGDHAEEIVMSDPFGGVYKKLVVRDNKLVGACLYGDMVDGSWYFKLLREGRSITDIRDRLMFGESSLGDTGHEGHTRAASMPARLSASCGAVSLPATKSRATGLDPFSTARESQTCASTGSALVPRPSTRAMPRLFCAGSKFRSAAPRYRVTAAARSAGPPQIGRAHV